MQPAPRPFSHFINAYYSLLAGALLNAGILMMNHTAAPFIMILWFSQPPILRVYVLS